MADKPEDARLARATAALNHLRDLDQQTRAIIMALETARRTKPGPQPRPDVPIEH